MLCLPPVSISFKSSGKLVLKKSFFAPICLKRNTECHFRGCGCRTRVVETLRRHNVCVSAVCCNLEQAEDGAYHKMDINPIIVFQIDDAYKMSVVAVMLQRTLVVICSLHATVHAIHVCLSVHVNYSPMPARRIVAVSKQCCVAALWLQAFSDRSALVTSRFDKTLLQNDKMQRCFRSQIVIQIKFLVWLLICGRSKLYSISPYRLKFAKSVASAMPLRLTKAQALSVSLCLRWN